MKRAAKPLGELRGREPQRPSPTSARAVPDTRVHNGVFYTLRAAARVTGLPVREIRIAMRPGRGLRVYRAISTYHRRGDGAVSLPVPLVHGPDLRRWVRARLAAIALDVTGG